jgi:hypothetical protein
LCNYYRDLWPQCAHTMAPLTSLCSSKTTFNWTQECQQAFNKTKSAMSRQVTLAYPDYSKPFHIHTDASKFQLGGVISQEDKPLAFYYRKLNQAQLNYTNRNFSPLWKFSGNIGIYFLDTILSFLLIIKTFPFRISPPPESFTGG